MCCEFLLLCYKQPQSGIGSVRTAQKRKATTYQIFSEIVHTLLYYLKVREKVTSYIISYFRLPIYTSLARCESLVTQAQNM